MNVVQTLVDLCHLYEKKGGQNAVFDALCQILMSKDQPEHQHADEIRHLYWDNQEIEEFETLLSNLPDRWFRGSEDFERFIKDFCTLKHRVRWLK